ncbi:LAFE_0G15698g1_1 [Lachancea fermentati]|uniref:LAFE_0G15698g1_1 n=1 Tax=Lachancea fermentati TaxID=4955 RepID=A0A1G4MII3_LACFM|nr:LAFE_0G15698g1_1 [Lachancea fermentati]
MSTFFDEMKTSFEAVPVESDNKIATSEFLEASESLVKLFDLLGNSAFTVVQKDLTGNITKIRKRLLATPIESSTLQDLVNNERASGHKTASEGLLWLTRGLQFTAQALRETIDNPDLELTKTFTDAYSKTLIKYHGILVRPVFKLAMKACPYRKDFFAKLGADQERVNEQLKVWLSSLEKIVKILLEFLAVTCKDL